MQKDGRKERGKAYKKTTEKYFGLYNELYLRQVRGGTQKGTEVHECSFQHFHSTSSDCTSQLLWLHFSTATSYIPFLPISQQSCSGTESAFLIVNKASLYDNCESACCYISYVPIRSLTGNQMKTGKLEMISILLCKPTSPYSEEAHILCFINITTSSLSPYIQSCCMGALRGKSPTTVHSQFWGTCTNLLCFL